MNAPAESDASHVERDLPRMLPAVAAAELEALTPVHAAAILRQYAGSTAAPVWERLAPAVAQQCLAEFSLIDAAQVLSGIDPSRAAAILVRLKQSLGNVRAIADELHQSVLRSLIEGAPITSASYIQARAKRVVHCR